jgi:hypothetical protein
MPTKDVRPRTQGPEPSTLYLAPRAFSAGVVDSLGEGFVLNLISELNASLDRCRSFRLFTIFVFYS